MRDHINIYPVGFKEIEAETKSINFNQTSDLQLGSLLSTLVASKPNGNILELGTGSGLSTSFLLQGMDNQSKLTTIDSENTLVSIR
ncbi:hypothetical protein [uncultured Gammaproteobacteria bacterium]|nr:hypothetical protein [uncultured Gammaproteobacteria bacterium]